LIAPVQAAAGHIRLKWDLFAAVKFGYSLRYPPLHYVADHQFYSMRLACRELRHLGYERIGLLLEKTSDTRSMSQWSAAFACHSAASGSDARVPPLLVKAAMVKSQEQFLRWFRKTKPQAVISQDNRVVDWIRTEGLRVPEDIGFANLDLPRTDNGFSGIFQNPELAGAEAVDFLHSLIQRHEYGIPTHPRAILTHGVWSPGSTVQQVASPKVPPGPRRRPAAK
jgi:LacI family transcriptional regulator